MFDSFGQTRALEHVVVCYLPGASSKVEAQDSWWSPGGVEHVHLTETAKMELPAVCTTEAHATSWPAWENHCVETVLNMPKPERENHFETFSGNDPVICVHTMIVGTAAP